MEALFKEVCRTAAPPDAVEFREESVRAEDIRVDQRYLGVRVELEARLAKAVIGLQVDVGFGDAVVPPPTSIEYPRILDFAPAHIQAYSRYTVVAEKLQAAVELGLANTRLKDFFDLFTLASRFDFEGPGLVAAIGATFARRGVPTPVEPPLAFSSRFSEAPEKAAQWKAFLRRARVRTAVPPLPELVETSARFVLEPLRAAGQNSNFARHWQPGGPCQP